VKRTIADARRILEMNAKGLNPEAFRQYQAEITAAEAAVKIRANAHVRSMYDDHVNVARNVSEGLCSVRDSARRLADQIKTGRITPAEAAAELERLRSGARAQRGSRERLVEVVDQMDAVETDPVAWHSNLAAKFPHMLNDFTF
jgi:hypothetical protein